MAVLHTIFAPATAPGKAGVAVLRLSGELSWDLVERLCAPSALPAVRQLSLRRLSTDDGEILDDALVVVFEGGASFTGERSAEIHLHGSVATVKAVLEWLSGQEGARLAEPGEFTRRALDNGRMDLAQVEGLADLVQAETEAQRKQAQRILCGSIGELTDGWRRMLLRASALVEAMIDFSDEDIPSDLVLEVRNLLSDVLGEVEQELRGLSVSERVRDGFEVAIVGRPNVGKSTLLNRLARREAAITSEYAGTTRDVVEVSMDLAGLPVTLLDTAGLRVSEDKIEQMGVARAIDRARAADLRVFLIEGREDLNELVPGACDIVAIAKVDLGGQGEFGVSGTTGEGVSELIERIGKSLSNAASSASTFARERHRVALVTTVDALQAILRESSDGARAMQRIDFVAEELRHAVRSLDSLVGRVDVEDVLGEIFGSFCIGK